MSHTPGPWKVATDLPAYAIYAENGRRVVQTPNQNNYSTPVALSVRHIGIESLDDARLIAAAPELLAELEHFVACTVEGEHIDHHDVSRAKAAIAKARGRG